jgi:hypothetical protein
MQSLPVLALVVLAVMATVPPGIASVQPQLFCWVGDSEFPVACEEDEDEDGSRSKAMLLGSSAADSGSPRPSEEAGEDRGRGYWRRPLI